VILGDVMRPGLTVVFCGTALGAKSAAVKAYYAGPGNRFWITLQEIGLTPELLKPQEYSRLPEFDIGLTDLCKTRSGSDQEVGRAAFDVGRLVAEVERFSPKWLAFNGKNSASGVLGRPVSYGEQDEPLGGAKTFVLPSTSGAARRYWDIGPWRDLAAAVGREPRPG
jgi:double-stranded uracil-DNA glycosylase